MEKPPLLSYRKQESSSNPASDTCSHIPGPIPIDWKFPPGLKSSKIVNTEGWYFTIQSIRAFFNFPSQLATAVETRQSAQTDDGFLYAHGDGDSNRAKSHHRKNRQRTGRYFSKSDLSILDNAVIKHLGVGNGIEH